MTLNEYLRFKSAPKLSGTKLSCGQGGCGACTVNLTDGGGSRSVASCLLPLTAVHGHAVTTVEGLVAPAGEPHPVQERVVQMQGTQCGFCTPGMVMSIFSALKPHSGGKAVTESQLETMDVLAGNICRCTGYRPLQDTVKSFGCDTTVRDSIMKGPVGPYNPSADPVVPKEALALPPWTGTAKWSRPTTMDALLAAWGAGSQVVAGHTGHGVYGDTMSGLQYAEHRPQVLDITAVPELTSIKESMQSLTIGAATTLARTAAALGSLAIKRSEVAEVCNGLKDHLLLIAGHQVRNTATVGGNIMMARSRGFASDVAPCLVALDTTVDYVDATGNMKQGVLLFNFLHAPSGGRELILRFNLPLYPRSVDQTTTYKTFRSSFRPRNAYALANAAFRVDMVKDRVTAVRLVFGALGGPPLRAEVAEATFLKQGKKILQNAGELVDSVAAEISVVDGPHAEYRRRAIQAFTLKFAASMCPDAFQPSDRSVASSLHAKGARHTVTSQEVPPPLPNGTLSPAFEPHPKNTAMAQATGGARFVDDAPHPIGTAFAAYVTIPLPNMRFTSLDTKRAQSVLGADFIGLYSAVDVPEGKNNIDWNTFMRFGPPRTRTEGVRDPGDEDLFLPPKRLSSYAGQAVAVVLASSQRAAEQGAAMVELVGLTPQTASAHVDPATAPPMEGIKPVVCFRGKQERTKAILKEAEASGKQLVRGPFSKGGQHHFYMEPQSALACPDEDSGMVLYMSTQGTQMPQRIVAATLGLAQNQVTVKFRRVGGGFGGKITRCMPVALAACLSARQFQRPVRLVLTREQDMAMVGGRQELDGSFSAAVDANGRIRALKVDLQMAGGSSLDFTALHAQMIAGAMDMVYRIDNMLVTINVTSTNMCPRTACRSPAHLEALMVIETVMDTIANDLGLSPEQVREANFVRPGMLSMTGLKGGMLPPSLVHDWTAPALWRRMQAVSEFDRRKKEVAEFNAANRWKKRGVAMTPAKYGLFRMPGMSAKVDIFTDGSVQVSTGGAEIGQGLSTKVAQVVCATFGALGVQPELDSLRFVDFTTEVTPNAAGAGGSTTSEMACFAVEEACNVLVARLRPAFKKARKASKIGVTWTSLIAAAFKSPVPGSVFDGTAFGFYLPPVKDIPYETFGAATSEVEIDCLTGETKVLATHLMFNSGPSINPAIDVGQVEGAFVMGLGQMLLEEVRFDSTTGALATTNTWDYKPPTAGDIPENFHVYLVDLHAQASHGLWGWILWALSGMLAFFGLPYKPSKGRPEYRSSKATGEPPMLMSYSIVAALRQAMAAARPTGKLDSGVAVRTPITVEEVSRFTWGTATSLTRRMLGEGFTTATAETKKSR
eukprot:CAMPEP_0114552482 /NCGR_PEP_ID=MMETSP0114-20121206/7146_1 /TAXON_ID=31324 /ORGANISM="Goniomonas sp, Strain m" /LENGTH=1343 /DNA_ID=CAMNT_0001737357 /DNA_START=87 /DNA_END=4118 /DNA_ORIENTATION=-